MRLAVFAFVVAFGLTACASSGRVVQISDDNIVGPRVVALLAPSAPWVIEIQNRLKKKGFRVLRWSSRARVTEQTSATRSESYNDAEARYILVIDGYAPYDWQNRCFGGGYKFNHISVDLVDAKTNETTWSQEASATLSANWFSSSAMTSLGVLKSSVLRGRLFISSAMSLS